MNSLDSALSRVRPGDVIKATLTVAAVILAALLVYRFFYIFFAALIAIMLYLAISPLVEWLNRRGIDKRTGMIVGYLVVILLMIGFLLLLVPLLLGQARTITEKLPAYYALIKQLLLDSDMALLKLIHSYLPAELALDRLPSLLLSTPVADPAADAASEPPWLVSAQTLFTSLFLITAVFAMAYYWMRDRDKIIYQFLLFFPADKRAAVEKLLDEMAEKVGKFYQGQLILCALVGGASFVAYWLVGLPFALTLGAVAFLCEAVPMIGPLLGAVPAILIALTISPTMTLTVVAINAVVQFLENNIFVPRIMDRTVGVNPIVTVLAIAAFSTLFGVAGALLAVPLAAILQVLFERTIFHFRPAAEEISGAGSAALTVDQRNRFSVLRIEAQDLAHDIRKRMRQKEVTDPADASLPSNPVDPRANSEIEELIEACALEFDQLLADREAANRHQSVRRN